MYVSSEALDYLQILSDKTINIVSPKTEEEKIEKEKTVEKIEEKEEQVGQLIDDREKKDVKIERGKIGKSLEILK